jgi:hypothetical protein
MATIEVALEDGKAETAACGNRDKNTEYRDEERQPDDCHKHKHQFCGRSFHHGPPLGLRVP